MSRPDPTTPAQKPDASDAKPRHDGSAEGKREPEPRKPKRLDPTRYGDWEKNGRCIDF
ncbi:MAG: DUF1674 domain-containing protein [Rhodanobacteraceae bacterium]